MADNITAPATGSVLATDDINGVHYLRAKIALGADGAAADTVGGAGAVAPGVQRVTLASDDPAVAALQTLVGTEYETVAASSTNQPLGSTGAAGDLLASLLVIPASTSPGAVQIKDGADGAITVFAGGTPVINADGTVNAAFTGGMVLDTGTTLKFAAAGNGFGTLWRVNAGQEAFVHGPPTNGEPGWA